MNGTQDAHAAAAGAAQDPPAPPSGAAHDPSGRSGPSDSGHPSGRGGHPSGTGRRLVRPGAMAATLYLLAAAPIGWFWAWVTGTGLVLSLVALPLGLAPRALVLLVRTTRWGARAERWWINALLGVQIRELYRAVPPGGSPRDRSRALRADPATWQDMIYLVLLAPLGTLWAWAAFTVWFAGFILLTFPIYYRFLQTGIAQNPDTAGSVDPFGQFIAAASWQEAVAVALIGMVVLLVAWSAVRGMAHLQAAIARSLLGPAQSTVLGERAEVLRVTRERAVDAAAAERRRIERDLHDGAQQRLVSLAMGLGMAKEKFAADPDQARKLLEEAHMEAKRAIAELRNLARGIHPAVLSDRGLDAALSALAGRSPVPVHVTVLLPERPPPLKESTAYFVVSEALTNVARHARATSAAVRVRTDGGHLIVEVWDNGKGGAEPAAGTGLIGLTDRVRAQDGTLTLSSPPGGPTLLVVELPL